MIFLTGGVDREAMRSFFVHQPQPLLEKPLDLAALARAAERLAPPGPPTALARDA